MRRHLIVLGALGLVGALAAPASAGHGDIHPTFKEQRVYFHCTGPTKVHNVNANNSALPAPWDATAPTTSIEQGGGCLMADPGALVNTSPSGGPADAAFKGQFVGNLKNMSVELWLAGPTNYSPIFGTLDVTVWMTVDGETIIPEGTRLSEVPLQVGSDGNSARLDFAITDLGSATDVLDENGNVVDVSYAGLADEDGDGELPREIELTVGMYYPDEAGVWAWDAPATASGITFNDATPVDTRLSAGLTGESTAWSFPTSKTA